MKDLGAKFKGPHEPAEWQGRKDSNVKRGCITLEGGEGDRLAMVYTSELLLRGLIPHMI